MNQNERLYRWGMVLLCLVGFGLRLYRIETQSVWWDEGISLNLATSSLADIVADRLLNIHPPLYFFTLKGWVALTGATPFATRYLSALAALGQIAVVYALTRRSWGKPAAVVAATLVVFSPLSIIYGQEIRVYAFLPLFGLGMVGVGWRLTHRHPRRRDFWLLGLLMWTAVHLHYIALFMVAYVGGWVAATLVIQQRWPDLRRLVGVGTAVILASLPWFVAVIANWTAVQAEANAGTYLTEPVPLDFLLAQVGAFHLTGLGGALGIPGVAMLTAVFGLLLLFLWLGGLLTQPQRPIQLLWSTHWLLPLLLALFVWSVRSFSHPRYVAMFAFTLFPLLGWLIAFPWSPRVNGRWLLRSGAALLTATIFTLSLLSLTRYFFDDNTAKPDMRGMTRLLENEAPADGLILIPDTDHSFRFEYAGETAVQMAHVADRPAVWSRLAEWTATTPPVFFLTYEDGTRDWQQLTQFALESAGTAVRQLELDELRVLVYALEAPIAAPQFAEQTAVFPNHTLRLTGAWLPHDSPVTDQLPIALRWRADGPISDRVQATIRLHDIDGWVLAEETVTLIDAQGKPTERWFPGEPVETYHRLTIPAGVPPLDYTVSLSLFTAVDGQVATLEWQDGTGAPQGQQIDLGEVSLNATDRPSIWTEPPVAPATVPRLVEQGIALYDITPAARERAAGQPLILELLWRAETAPVPDLIPVLSLRQEGHVLTAVSQRPAQARYPTDQWGVGEWVREHRVLTIPPEASGVAELWLEVGAQTLLVQTVQINETASLFTPPPVANPVDALFAPVGRLIGFELAENRLVDGQPFSLTLLWESTAESVPVSYAVFTQLLDKNGRLIAQHDGVPENGRRPTTSWVPGEYLLDAHPLTFRETGYTGPARLIIGLYDPLTGTRLTLPTGQDFVTLPVAVEVVAEGE